ncbi:hypothetical protein HYDPIDRAFT_171649, partial [Hydnomerulius pinastri MD-312]
LGLGLLRPGGALEDLIIRRVAVQWLKVVRNQKGVVRGQIRAQEVTCGPSQQQWPKAMTSQVGDVPARPGDGQRYCVDSNPEIPEIDGFRFHLVATFMFDQLQPRVSGYPPDTPASKEVGQISGVSESNDQDLIVEVAIGAQSDLPHVNLDDAIEVAGQWRRKQSSRAHG